MQYGVYAYQKNANEKHTDTTALYRWKWIIENSRLCENRSANIIQIVSIKFYQAIKPNILKGYY